MEVKNLHINTRAEFRAWLTYNSTKEKECWVVCRRGSTPPTDCVWYLDAVEEALCFGWIDATVKSVESVSYQRFTPRRQGCNWSELNKERCRRLERLGLMTDAGRAVLPDMSEDIPICQEILSEFEKNPRALRNFKSFPALYQRVRIDTIQIKRNQPELFRSRLLKLIEASEKGLMIGEWNDHGRLLNY